MKIIRLSNSVAGLGWFRIFGIGLHWKDTSRHTLSFSERNGYKKMIKIGTWRIGFLPKHNTTNPN